ncbi:response regulator [Cohnella hashimotonis]|uniref:Response regulator transcription factor n=1 Tax=Cohnella hashimotonis TaxID=2826895 RepID=A0ABT6TCQ8_9BACL|nr:response regulator transcription factor [Cohnella hashimotonis]MDI4644606.1 response regulator transcription factor [Cohnella hashimotonis]
MDGGWRILLVDDHRHARQGMREIVEGCPDFIIVGEAASGEEAIGCMPVAKPDLVLMDIHMPGMGGLAASKVIKDAYPWVKIVIATVSDEPAHLFEALKKGAQGYLLKNLNPSAWREYLRAVASDDAPLSPDIALSILREFAGRGRDGGGDSPAEARSPVRRVGLPESDEPPREDLTPREKEILLEVARGLTNRDVASALGVSEHTVKNHLKNILQKLHLGNRVQLARYAYEQGIVEP